MIAHSGSSSAQAIDLPANARQRLVVTAVAQSRLFDRYPLFFRAVTAREKYPSNIGNFGIQCGVGWYPLIEQAAGQVECELRKVWGALLGGMSCIEHAMVMEQEGCYPALPICIDIRQVNGALVIALECGFVHQQASWSRLLDIVENIKKKSYSVCECCGNRGKMRKPYWQHVYCDGCVAPIGAFDEQHLDDEDAASAGWVRSMATDQVDCGFPPPNGLESAHKAAAERRPSRFSMRRHPVRCFRRDRRFTFGSDFRRERMSQHPLIIEMLDGEYTSHTVQLARLCLLEDDAPNENKFSSVLDEAQRVLEQHADKLRTIRPSGSCFTVFISRGNGREAYPLVRLDVFARQGVACAGVVGPTPRWDTGSVMYSPGDGAIEIARKILSVEDPL